MIFSLLRVFSTRLSSVLPQLVGALGAVVLLFFGSQVVFAQDAKFVEQSGTLSNYKLAAGDVITIRVFGEDDLSREKVRLTDAGTIPYPVLGEIRALGLTIGEIESAITAGLTGRYLVNPRVSVTIEEYRPFYISGMVERPGGYPYQPGLTVLKASSLAGGFKELKSSYIAGGFRERASLLKKADIRISIIRENNPDAGPEVATINTPVSPGDIIFIEETKL